MKAEDRKRKPLTEVEIRNLKPADKSYKMGDGGGLYVEIFPNGSKLWRLKYRLGGIEKRLALGAWPAVSLKAAREEREQAKELLAQGIDPGEQKKQQQQEVAQKAAEATRTFRFVAMDWYDTQTTGNSEKTRQGTMGRLNRHILPAIGDKLFSDVTFDDLVLIVRGLENVGKYEMAKRVSEIIGRICRYAKIRRWSQHNIAEDLNAIREKRPASSKKGFPAITSKEGVAEMLRRIKTYVDSGRSTTAMNAALLLYPLTAVRAQELFLAEWSEIDFDGCIWRIPAEHMKRDRPHDVPLSDQALQIFKRLYEYRLSNKYILPSGRGHLTGEAINQRMHAAGIPKGEMTLHSWRKVFSTLAHEAGVPHSLVEKQLAHLTGDETARAYDKSQYLEVRRGVMQWWADYLDALRDGVDLPEYRLKDSGLFA